MTIRNIPELIEQLEAVRVELRHHTLTIEEYEAVGWADRPLRQLIEQARDEAELQSWQIKRATDYTRRPLAEVKP